MSSDKPGAFLKLFLSERHRLVRLVGRIVGCRDTAEDIAQDAFVRLWGRPVGSDDMGLLFRTGQNLAIDHVRARQVRSTFAEGVTAEQFAPHEIQPDDAAAARQELEGKLSLAEGLDLNASYTYQDVEITKSNDGNEGMHPVIVPKQMASLWADYTLQQDALAGLGFGAGLRYVGPSWGDDLNTVKNPSYTLVDAAVHYDLEAWRLALNASNLFDKEYVSSCSWGNCYMGYGRTVIGSVRYRW